MSTLKNRRYEAHVRSLKDAILLEIGLAIEAREITDEAAEEVIGERMAVLTDALRGRHASYGIVRLMRALSRLGRAGQSFRHAGVDDAPCRRTQEGHPLSRANGKRQVTRDDHHRRIKEFLAGEIMRAIADQGLTDKEAAARAHRSIDTLERIMSGRHPRMPWLELMLVLSRLGVTVGVTMDSKSTVICAGGRRRTIKSWQAVGNRP
jgi:hypothetical protein